MIPRSSNSTTPLIAGFVLIAATVAIASFLNACSKAPNPIKSTTTTTNISSNYRTPDDCLREIDAIWDDTFGTKTKSGLPKQKPRVGSISVITSPQTKVGHAADSVGYLINFAHESGFALVRTDKTKAPFVAISDSGNLDEEGLMNPGFASADDGQRVFYGILRQALFGQDTESDTNLDKPVKSRSLTDIEWVIDDFVSPLVHVKWGQGYPLNMYMPLSSNPDFGPFSYYKGRNPAGCVMVMLGQIIATTGHPQYFSLPPYYISFDTSVLSEVSNYQNYFYYENFSYDAYVTDSLSRANTDFAARMLRTIADAIPASFNYSSTSANMFNAIQYLSSLEYSFYGDTHNQDFLESLDDRELLYLYLGCGKPLPIYGACIYFDTFGFLHNISHAWLIDGFLNRSDANDPDIQENLIHLNWGFQGRCDGYYTDGIIDMNEMVTKDPVIDTNNEYPEEWVFDYLVRFFFYGYLFD